MTKEIISGIYMIRNKVNGKVYIGSSKNIYKRWNEHKLCLKKGNHQNKHLQNAWNKYKEESFEFIILKKTESKKNILIKNEQKYIDQHESHKVKSGYNMNPKAEIGCSIGCYKIWIQKYGLKKANEMWKNVTTQNSIANSKENNAMWQIKRPLVGELNKKIKSKAILQFDLNGNLIKEFPSVTNASLSLSINRETIKNFRNHKRGFAAGFIWKYKN